MEKDEPDYDIVEVLNTIIPCEKHLPGMNYCGPGTNLNKKLNPDGTPKPQYLPVDRVDEIALKHDIAYQNNGDLRSRNKADSIMLNDLRNIKRPTCRERMEICIVFPILYLKRAIGSLILKCCYRNEDGA
jgi:hypothetical protein